MPLRPWYKIVTPREDLREGKPFDAPQSAVHLDQAHEGRASADYQKPERFSAPHPSSHIEEKRWVDGVLARKKGLGF